MTVTGAIWREQLTAEQRAVLGRDAGTIADPRPDVLVIGGGILGVAIAASVHDAGLGSVQLIEAGRLGAGATGGATGLLIPEPHQWSDPETFVDLERASLERWRYLDQVTPGGLGLVELDWIGLAPDPGGLAAHQPNERRVAGRGQDRRAGARPGLAPGRRADPPSGQGEPAARAGRARRAGCRRSAPASPPPRSRSAATRSSRSRRRLARSARGRSSSRPASRQSWTASTSTSPPTGSRAT